MCSVEPGEGLVREGSHGCLWSRGSRAVEESAGDRPDELPEVPVEQQWAQRLVDQARADGVKLVGPGGLLAGITRRVLETALETEMADHLGYDKGDPAGRGGANERNGHSAKTVHTDLGPVRIKVPRDRAGTFTPQVVPKHARRVGGLTTRSSVSMRKA